MIAEFGVFFLILAFLFAILLGTVPTIGLIKGKSDWINSTKTYVIAQSVFILLAYFCLTLCFLNDDFSVIYVASNSSVTLPWFYKLCAVWGGHEGAMLLWVLILNFWTVLVLFFSKSLDKRMQTRVLIVLGWLSLGFILFLLATSNPFLRQFTILNTTGRDLNPLLQDPGFLFHPPMLYMGYVGFSVAFAFAIAALWEKKLEPAWCKWTRPWTLAAWSFLTLGITLGSWWAYRELGWGGWWFWDPVENASFMPWLAGTALIHALIISEKRQQFQSWALLLAISAFSLSLLGTFLVRSGVLTSVHAFAVDPERGLYILVFLLCVIGGSLFLFALRAQQIQSNQDFSLFSRESSLLMNTIFLMVIMLTVLMGTLYPLLIDGLNLGKISVGAPYFNSVFVPLMIPLLIFMGIGIHLQWKKDSFIQLVKRINHVIILSILIPLILLWITAPSFNLSVYVGLMLASWVILSTLQALYWRIKVNGVNGISLAYWGMVLAHCGIAITVIGIAVSNSYGREDDVQLAPGESIKLSGYTIQFNQSFPLIGPNYTGTKTVFYVSRDNKTKVIFPEKRIYQVAQMAMTESAIDVTPFRDIYVALGEPLKNNSWSVRIYYKPLVRWIWFGGLLMVAGGLLALLDARYYRKNKRLQGEAI